MFILKGVKVICFDTLLQVLILKGFTLHQNCATLYRRWTEGKKPNSSRQGRDKRRGEPQVDDGWTETELTTGIPNIQSIREVAVCQEKEQRGTSQNLQP